MSLISSHSLRTKNFSFSGNVIGIAIKTIFHTIIFTTQVEKHAEYVTVALFLSTVTLWDVMCWLFSLQIWATGPHKLSCLFYDGFFSLFFLKYIH